ncbi:hypothetical protein WA577_006307 [Blastocystis sp. JDR]
MLSRGFFFLKQTGVRCLSSSVGRNITSQSAYLVSEETPLTKYFARVPKIEEIEKPKLWINETMEKMTSVEDATNILRTFRKNHYFLNSKAISAFILNGLRLDVRKTVDAICDPEIALQPKESVLNVVRGKLRESGDGDYTDKLDKYLSSIKPEEPKEEVYTPYEHLRTVKPNADFYALEYTVDVKKDILGEP